MTSATDDYPLAYDSSTSVTVDGRPFLLLRCGQELRLYENRCPHTHETLDPTGGSVLDANGQLVTCQRHGAQFLSTGGECVGGPCLGEFLTSVAFVAVGEDIYLD